MGKWLRTTGAFAGALLVLVLCDSASAQVPTSACPKANVSNTTAICPKISGSLLEAGFVSGSAGEWTGSEPITIGFQWQRCTTSEAATCADIPGENELKYLIADGDAGNRLRLVVTAANGEGSDSRTSVISAVVSPGLPGFPGENATFPASLEALSPAMLSAPLAGDTLRIADGPGSKATSDGWFNPKATSYTYAWRRCAAAGALATCVTIAGATERSYTLTDADAGHSVRARLTGTNSSGSKALLTAATNPVGSPTATLTASPPTETATTVTRRSGPGPSTSPATASTRTAAAPTRRSLGCSTPARSSTPSPSPRPPSAPRRPDRP